MAGNSASERAMTNRSNWELDYTYADENDRPIKCDNRACALGCYIIERLAHGTSRAPACTTCEFSADLTEVFDPKEPRYEPGAPEDFKLGAARVLAADEHSMEILGIGRHGVVAAIEAYTAEQPVTQ